MVKFNKNLENIKVYEAGKPIELIVRDFNIKVENVIKLASNENPNGCSLKVSEAISKFSKKASLYPDDSFFELKNGIADKFKILDKNIIIGAGSDQILEFISKSFLDKNSSVLMSRVTFAMYEIYAKQMGAKIIRTNSFRHKADEIIPLLKKHKIKILYLCSPNNPTGDAITKKDILKIISNTDKSTLIVIDGAYMEYASAKDKKYEILPKDILKFENVIYLGTFSKAYGLGGMRIGYGIANKDIIYTLHKVRSPFNITTLSLIAGIEALKDEEFIQKSISLHLEEIKRYEYFAEKFKIEYIDSYTNFITYIFSKENLSTEISNSLLKKGIIIRDLKSYGINAIRITVGLKHQNIKLLENLKNILKDIK